MPWPRAKATLLPVRALVPLLSLVLISLLSVARAETVFLTSGWDQTRGYFEGQITVDRHPEEREALEVVRERRFEDGGVERLIGRGRRSGNWVRAVFHKTTGLSGSLQGSTKGPATVMQIKQEKDDGVWTESFTEGQRTSLSRGRPASAEAPEPGDLNLPAGVSRAEVEHKDDADFVERDLDTLEEPSVIGSDAATQLKRFESALFVKGQGDTHAVSYNDVFQGRLGNCYLLAALIATARTDPEKIVGMIQTNPDGTYQVELRGLGPFGRGASVRVSDAIPSDQTGNAPAFVGFGDSETRQVEGREVVVHEIWPSVIEKAWAKYKGSYAKTGDFYSATAFSFIGGKAEGFDPRDMSDAEILAVLKEAHEKGYPMTLGTNTPQDAGRGAERAMKSLRLYGYHAYAFMGLEGERVRLYNPWGRSHPKRALKISEIRKLFASMSQGKY